MKKYFIILFLLFLLLQSAVAQNPFITNYTITDGLPSNKIFCVYQDKNGFMWFGTNAGVVRFDGSNFISPSKEDGLSGDFVLRIKEDFNGRLWFLNNNGTVNFFHENTMFNEKNAPFLSEIKTDFFWHNFFQDNDSTLYFYNLTAEIVAIKDNELIDYINYDSENSQKELELLYLNKNSDNNFQLWTTSGIYEFENIDDKLKKQQFSEILLRTFHKGKNENYGLDQFGNIHLFRDSEIIQNNIIKSESTLINSIIVDEDDFIWVSTFDKGVYCYKGDNVILQLDIKGAQNLVIDNENNIWTVSNYDGIYKINRDILKYKFIGKDSFEGRGITDLAHSNQGGVWATNGRSLFLVRDTHIFPGDITIGNEMLTNIYQLKNNTIILNGSNTNLYFVNNIKVNTKTATVDYNLIGRLKFRVNKIVVDSTECFLYSFFTNRLFKTDIKNSFNSKLLNIKKGRIYNVFFNKKNELIVNAAKNYNVTNTICADSIYQSFNGEIISKHLIIDNENELFNVVKNKLYLLNNKKTYDLTSQFKSQIDFRIKDMIYDGSTLFFFTIKTVYFISNPLKVLSDEQIELNRLNIEFNNINDLYCQDSVLYVASDDGITFIPVEECVNAQVQPTKPYFYKVSLDNENYDPSLGNVEFKNQKRLGIEFSSLNYSSIPSNYSYMLEGIDENWITGNETRVVYLNLAPGSYTFKLKSRKNREQYSEVIELPVIVHPTIFQRTITKVLLILSLLFSIYLLVRVRYHRKMKQKETEHLLTTLENKALQSMMNPHFIFNALGSIQGFLLQNKSAEAGTYLSQFARLIRQNMNSLKSNYICIDDEIERLRNYIELEKLRMNNKFTYQIEVDNQLDSYEVCIPSMIVQPFVENAIWHGISSIEGDGFIKIIFKCIDEKSIEVLVEDNGIGIKSTEMFSKSGHGLNMGVALTKKRLKLIGEQQGVNSEISTKNLTPGAVQSGTQIKIIVPIVDGIT